MLVLIVISVFFSNHLRNKHPTEYERYANPEAKDEAEEKRPKFAQAVANRMFARAVGPSTESYRHATSEEFSEFLYYIAPHYQHPSRQTLVSNIRKEADRAKALLKNLLKNVPMVSNFS
jgi:hypothetical protein